METRIDSPTRGPGSDLAVLAALAFARLLLHCATNWHYGVHHDELGVLAASARSRDAMANARKLWSGHPIRRGR